MAVVTLVPAVAYPNYIGCDFRVIPTKSSAGRNIMVTTDRIMGSPPATNNNLVSTSKNGRTVTITFASTFSMGFAHATVGTFNAPQFSDAAENGARCAGTQSIVYKDTPGPTNSITWTAPIGVNSVTLSFASAQGYGPVSRMSATITDFTGPAVTTPSTTSSTAVTSSAAGPVLTTPSTISSTAVTSSAAVPSSTPTSTTSVATPVGGLYRKITSGTCASNGYRIITYLLTCQVAAQALQLSDITAESSTVAPRPEGCYYVANQLFLSGNPANTGRGAVPNFEVLCEIEPLTVATTTTPSTTTRNANNHFAIITEGTCASNGMLPIPNISTCAAAAETLGLAQADEVLPSSVSPKPEGCRFTGNQVRFSTNLANKGYPAQAPSFKVICSRVVAPRGVAAYARITQGTCRSNKMMGINDFSTCQAAVLVLKLPNPTVRNTSDAPKPEGCFYNTFNNNNRVYFSTNASNAGFGASPGYEIICLAVASIDKSAASSSAGSTTNYVIIGGGTLGALSFCVMVCCVVQKIRDGTKRFEA